MNDHLRRLENLENLAKDAGGGELEGKLEAQLTGSPLTPAADWYSVGVLLFKALTGRQPFQGTMTEVLSGKDRQTQRGPPA